jgi:hypothetical protein
MEYIDGLLFEEVWSDFSEDALRDLHLQLHDFIRQLQSLKGEDSPGPIGGGVSDGALFTPLRSWTI